MKKIKDKNKMNNYDVIVIGAGLTGSVLAYELARYKLKVLLLEKDHKYNNSTTLSYGGISYWCGTDKLTTQLCQESIKIYRNLKEELDNDIEFRELDLLYTIDKNQNPEIIENKYRQFYLKPELLSIEESCQLEPLLDPHNINSCLKFPQGHVNPSKTILAYQQCFLKLGGKIAINLVNCLLKKEDKIIGVKTNQASFFSEQIILCAGAFSRQLLQEIAIKIPLYFTHAQLIKTIPTEIKLNSLVMPANLNRFTMEKEMTKEEKEILWANPHDEIQGEVMETGAIQFLDGSLCLGQISQIITNPLAKINSTVSEAKIREEISKILPLLSNVSGTLYNCQVAFSKSVPFQVGKIAGYKGLSIFSGFTSPFVFVPPLAKHFAGYLVNQDSKIEEKLSLSLIINTQ